MARDIQSFHVGIKAFIMDGDNLLMVKGSDGDPHWELPGGRIDVGEELLPAEDILRREIREELGEQFHCDIGRPILTWSRRLANSEKFVYLIGFQCRYIRGTPELSHEHTEFRWVTEEESKSLALADQYHRALESFWKTDK